MDYTIRKMTREDCGAAAHVISASWKETYQGIIPEEELNMKPILGMEEPWRYRNKAQFPIGRDRDGRIIAGFYAARSHRIVECRDCLLGVTENRKILDIIINITRSIPFLILLILIMPFTKAIVGKSYGTTATIVPPMMRLTARLRWML